MTDPARRRAVALGVSGPVAPAPSGRADRLASWVSSDAVRQAIGAWAATARVGRSRPTTELVRTAVAVACAIAEVAASEAVDSGALLLRPRDSSGTEDADRIALTRPVAYDAAQLGELSGASPRDVDRALDVLRQARVVSQPQGERSPLVLNGDCLEPAPAVAAVAWATVRERLAAADAPIAAPCAMLRALAERLGAPDVGRGGGTLPAVRVSVRDLELVTEFRRSTVSEAIASLVRARLLDADTRAGHTGRFVIRPAAFGLPDDEAPVSLSRGPARFRDVASAASQSVAGAPCGAAGVVPAETYAGRIAPATTAAEAPVLIGTFAGTPIYASRGTPLVVECDADGRWSCRVGPFLKLGPITPQ